MNIDIVEVFILIKRPYLTIGRIIVIFLIACSLGCGKDSPDLKVTLEKLEKDVLNAKDIESKKNVFKIKGRAQKGLQLYCYVEYNGEKIYGNTLGKTS